MTRLFSLAILVLIVISINADTQTLKEKQNPGSTFDEILVETNLEVRRKSKESRGGKQLLTNEQPAMTSPSQMTSLASKLLLSNGSSVEPKRRKKRSAIKRLQRSALAKYLLRSRKV